MKVIQHTFASFLQVAEMILTELDKGINYPRFQLKLQDALNELGKTICREVLEASDEYLRQHKEERQDWSIVRQDEKAILSPFGVVNYTRTYFRHNITKQYRHLVDELAGYGPHARLDAAFKANLVDFSNELSYNKSGKEPEKQAKGTQVSGQTVLNSIRGMDPRVESFEPLEKRKVKILYIEADEDHVACQDGKNKEVPLIYVHEGKARAGKRSKLKNPYYFTGIYRFKEDLWFEVLDYLESTYDFDRVERVYISGDGGKWIRTGLQIIPKATFVLDRYHLSKYIVSAAGRDNELSSLLWQAIDDNDINKVKAIFKEAYLRAESKGRKKAVSNARRYITANWDGIRGYKTDANVVGCSAEGHVSHILSARLSSRPMGWSIFGMDRMARIRVLKANGHDIREEYLKQQTKSAALLKVIQAEVEKERKKLEQPPFEMLDNLPALRGPKTALYRILHSLKTA